MNDTASMRTAIRALTSAAAVTFVLRGIGTALSFGTHLALARWMGVQSYGSFIYIYTWTLALGILGKLGFDRAAVRYGAELLASGALGDYAALRRLTLSAGAVSATVVALFFAAGAAVLAPGDMRNAFWLGSAAVPLLAVHHIYVGTAQGLKRVVQATVPELVLRNGLLGVFAGAWWIAGHGVLTVDVAVGLHVLAVATTVIVDSTWMRFGLSPDAKAARPTAWRAEWVRYSVQMAVVGNVVAWTLQMDVLLVGALAGTAVAATYSVAARVAQFVPWASLATMILFAPVIAELSARGDRGALQHVTTVMARRIALVSTTLAAILWLAHGPLLAAFGPGYGIAAIPLAILLVAQAVQDWLGPVPALMNYSGQQAKSLRVVVLGAALSLGVQLILIPSLGSVGAALGTAAALLLNSTLLYVFVRRTLGVDASILGIAAPQHKRDSDG